mmetsp:Transcript_22168/g.62049  ORF Transcript_22168/g.62049 Transcript_22168/m.62049 type:complete len:278 (-) Transcript_22168:918-1751(-)
MAAHSSNAARACTHRAWRNARQTEASAGRVRQVRQVDTSRTLASQFCMQGACRSRGEIVACPNAERLFSVSNTFNTTQRHEQTASKPSSPSESEKAASVGAASCSTMLSIVPRRSKQSALNSRLWHIGLLKSSAMLLERLVGDKQPTKLLRLLFKPWPMAARRFMASSALVRDSSLFGSTGGRAAARPAFTRIGIGMLSQSVVQISVPRVQSRPLSALLERPSNVGLDLLRDECAATDPLPLDSLSQGNARAAAALGLSSWSLSKRAVRHCLAPWET